jgi:hypothetical protein
MITNPQTTDEMLAEIEAMGARKIGDVSDQEWRDYNALVLRCVRQMKDELRSECHQ